MRNVVQLTTEQGISTAGSRVEVPIPLVHGDGTEVELVLALEHDFLLGDFEEGGRAEGRAEGEKGQGRFLCLPVLTQESLHSTSDVKPLGNRKVASKI